MDTKTITLFSCCIGVISVLSLFVFGIDPTGFAMKISVALAFYPACLLIFIWFYSKFIPHFVARGIVLMPIIYDEKTRSRLEKIFLWKRIFEIEKTIRNQKPNDTGKT